jgi:hypothetical protein
MVISNGLFKMTVKLRSTDFYIEPNQPFISEKPVLIDKMVLTFPKHFVFTKMSLYLIYEKKRR